MSIRSRSSFIFLFQSTHPHGVRHLSQAYCRANRGFNPRTHTGCDYIKNSIAQIAPVSIHAPTRGATRQPLLRRQALPWFQSTHPHGVRLPNTANAKLGNMFQSTHPHGVRLCTAFKRKFNVTRFNPRTHTGCDFFKLGTGEYYHRGFNPRTHTGCDNVGWMISPISSCFNPRTHTGCDFPSGKKQPVIGVSIHAPTRGATQPLVIIDVTTSFNPRTHTGCDARGHEIALVAERFQSTHPHGVRLRLVC